MKQLTLFASEDTDTSQSASQSTGGHGKGIFFPCPIAREMLIGEVRCNHIKHCPECKRLIQELDKEVGYER